MRGRYFLAGVPLVVAGAVFVAWLAAPNSGPETPLETRAGWPERADIGGGFELVDHTGRTVTDRDFLGRFRLIYFGYTSCPDVCPTTLQRMTLALNRLNGDEVRQLQPLFISIDPERDTPEVMASYVENFHPRLIGLTGSPEQVAKAAKAYRLYYSAVEKEGDDHYLMDHTSFVYLISPDGDLLELMPDETTPVEMAATIREAVARAP